VLWLLHGVSPDRSVLWLVLACGAAQEELVGELRRAMEDLGAEKERALRALRDEVLSITVDDAHQVAWFCMQTLCSNSREEQ
jgi:hypothetical protein